MVSIGETLTVKRPEGDIEGRLENGILIGDEFYGIFRLDNGRPIIGQLDLDPAELKIARKRFGGNIRSRKVIFEFMHEIYKNLSSEVLLEAIGDLLPTYQFVQIMTKPQKELAKLYATFTTSMFFKHANQLKVVDATNNIAQQETLDV